MIGHLKAATSLPVYEPAREKVIYANVRAANKGPLPDIELPHIYERIIDVMRALQRNELASERNAQATRGPRHGAQNLGCGLPARRPRQGRSNDCSNAGECTEEQIHAVIDAMVEAGVDVHRTTGATQTILAGVGHGGPRLSEFEVLPGVLHVHRICSPYKLAGRGFRPEGTMVSFANGVKVGGKQVVIMAGPCSVEIGEQILTTAKRVKAAGGSFCAEARSSRAARRMLPGHGHSGLKLMREAADETGCWWSPR